MKATLWRLCLVPLLCALSAQSALPSWEPPDPSEILRVAESVTIERYPDADAVLIDNRIATRYAPDGTAVTKDASYIKLLTERGRRDYRTRGLRHTIPYDTVEIRAAAILRSDGTRIEVDPQHFARDMVEPSQMQSNIYNPNSRLLRLTYPGVEIGDILYLSTLEHTVKPRVPDSWAGYGVFEYRIPILRIDYVVEEPDALPLRHLALRDPIPDTVTYQVERVDPGHQRHVWRVENVPRMFPEPNMPPHYTQVQRLLLSTSPDWEAISRWYWFLSEPRLEAVTDDMRRTVDELVADALDQEAVIQRLFTYVSRNIRYMGITTEIEAPGYEPRDVGVTFHNRYGVCRDKAAVLVAMLRLAGLPAYPVLIHTEARKDDEVPQPYFNHAIVAVDDGAGGYLLMDPTDETVRERMPAFLGNRNYLVARPEGESLRLSPVSPAEANLTRIETRGALRDDDALELDSRIVFEGINDQAYRSFFARQSPEDRRRFAEGLVAARLAGAELTDFRLLPEDPTDTGQALEIRFRARTRAYPVMDADDREGRIALPWLGDALGYVNFIVGRTGLEARRFPLETGMACGVEETLWIDLGAESLVLHKIPENRETVHEGVRFRQAFERREAGVLQAHSQLMIDAPEFLPHQYDALRALLADVEHAYRVRPRVRRTTPPAEDSRLLSAARHIVVDSPQAWTVTDHFRREILTFAGAKRHAELKLPYNTAWQTVELVSATVSNRNGRVHAVVPEERNRMDAAWVGGAPRYPASQTLVVSLPGVENGSIIETTVRKTVRDAPVFWHQQAFRGADPVLAASLEIDLPSTLEIHQVGHDGDALALSREVAGERVRLRWESGAQPRILNEDRSPPTWSMGPAVFLSSADPAAVAREVYAALDAAIEDADPTLAETAARLTEDLPDAVDQLRAIRDFVLRTIRHAGPVYTELPLSAFSPAGVTLREGYGHQADQAILMCALLRAAGFNAQPLLASARLSRVETLQAPWLDAIQYGVFDQVLVRVLHADEIYFFNDTNHYAPLRVTHSVDHPTLERGGTVGRITRPPEDHAATFTDWVLELDAEGTVHVTQTVTYRGGDIAGFRRTYAEQTPEERDRHHQELVGALSRGALRDGPLETDLDAYPGRRRFAAHLPRYAVRADNRLLLVLPETPRGLGVRGDWRQNPFYLAQPLNDRTTWQVRLPPNTRMTHLRPMSQTWSLPDGLGEVRLDVDALPCPEGETPEYRLIRTIELFPGILPPERYAAWREVHRRMLHPGHGTIEIELSDADGL